MNSVLMGTLSVLSLEHGDLVCFIADLPVCVCCQLLLL